MLSLANVSAAQAENYYCADDYYTRDHSSQSGSWFGKGAIALQLDTAFDPEAFKHLLQGVAPDGSSLHAKAINPKNHRAATDYTFSAPKSVSIAALIQQDWRVLEAHQQAVQTALQVMEERYGQTRVRTESGRERVRTGNLIAAVFQHETSRAQDPQLHSHCVVINATQMPGGSWRSLSNEEIIANQKLLGEIYQNELAFRLRQFGYEIEHRTNGQFELRGYSQELLNTFSTRTRQIQNYLEQWEQKLEREGGQPLHASQKKQATLGTRHSKRFIPREVLLAGWQQQIVKQGLNFPNIPNRPRSLSESSRNAAAIAGKAGITHAAERESVFRRSKVERFALENHIGQQSFIDLQRAIAQINELVLVDPIKDKYTTQTALWREQETVRLMQMAKGKAGAVSTQAEVGRLISQVPALTSGQQGALQLAATTTDQFLAWQGVAGAGKTFCLQLLAELAEEKGYKVRGFGPSAEAAHVLRQEAKIESTTIASYLLSQDLGSTQRELWVVDEAGLLSAKDAHALLQKAIVQHAKVVLIGDTRQLSAVEAGNPFKSLQSAGIATAFLEESLRQKRLNLKAAVTLIAQGKVEQGIEQLKEAGAIQEVSSLTERSQQLTHDYLSLSLEERQRTLVLANTHAERSIITDRIRSALKAEGSLGTDCFTSIALRSKDLTATQAQYVQDYAIGDVIVPVHDYKRQGLQKNQPYTVVEIDRERNRLTLETSSLQALTIDPTQCERKTVYSVQFLNLAVGDRLRWTRNDRAAGIRNGQTFTITNLDPRGHASVTYDDGREATVNLSGNQYADYAWVRTTYSSQGKTADRVLAVMERNISRESFYVSVSRAKHYLTLYTPDLAELTRRAQRSTSKENPSDYIPLFQVIQNHAQTQKDFTKTSSSKPDGRNLAERIGESVADQLAAPLRRDRQFASSLKRIESFTSGYSGTPEQVGSQSSRDFEPVSLAIAESIRERRDRNRRHSELEQMRQWGTAMYQEYAAHASTSNSIEQDHFVAIAAFANHYSPETVWWIVSQGDEAQRLKHKYGRQEAILYVDRVVDEAQVRSNQRSYSEVER